MQHRYWIRYHRLGGGELLTFDAYFVYNQPGSREATCQAGRQMQPYLEKSCKRAANATMQEHAADAMCVYVHKRLTDWKKGWGRAGRPAMVCASFNSSCVRSEGHALMWLAHNAGRGSRNIQPTPERMIYPRTLAFTARTQDFSWDALEDQVCCDVVATAAGDVGALTELEVRAAAPSAAVPATAVSSELLGAEKLPSCEYAWKGDGRALLPTLQL